jgi:hypothetical protein
MGVDGTGSGSCPVAGFGISCVEPSGSATRLHQSCVVWFLGSLKQRKISAPVSRKFRTRSFRNNSAEVESSIVIQL